MPKYLTEAIFGLFEDIFTLNADYIAWKLLQMALEVEYMMEYSIQFVDLGYCFQGHLRPAKMTQKGTLDCEAIYLLYYWLLQL